MAQTVAPRRAVALPAPANPLPIAARRPATTTVGAAADRLLYVDVLRALATAAVVLLHTAALEWNELPLTSSGWRASTAVDSLTRWCVPVFFMLTGSLFLGRTRAVEPGSVLRRSLPRLVVAYLAWTAFYAWFGLWSTGREVTLAALRSRLPQSYYHLWFLPAIIAVYLALPVLWRVCQDRRLAKYLVVLGLLLVVLPGMAGADSQHLAVRAAKAFRPDVAAGWLVFVVGGHLAATTRRRVPVWLLALALVGATVATHLLTVHSSLQAGHRVTTWFAYLTPNVTVAAFAAFLLLRRAEPVLHLAPGVAMWRWLSANSFGVYLVHPALLLLWDRFTPVTSTGAAGAVVAWSALLPVSYAISWALRRLPFGSYLA